MQSVSIVGCGYTGWRLAERLVKSGASVRGFATRAESLRQITAAGAQALLLDLDTEFAPIDFMGHVLYYCVPPAAHHGDPRLVRFLNGVLGAPKRFIYLSTTGVYGDHAGGRVDEDTPPAPVTERAARRVVAEDAMRAWADSRGVSWCVLRVGAIYGAGRLPFDRPRRAQSAVVSEDAKPVSRIHVTDLVTASIAAGFAPIADQRIYNVTDGSEESSAAFARRVARLANLALPPLVSRVEAAREISAFAHGGWRRVDNHRMLTELAVTLDYNDLDAGIRACLGQM